MGREVQHMQKTYRTERLLVRPTGIEDSEFILELLNTPKFIKYIGDRNVRTVKEAQVYIEERMLPQLEQLGYGNYTVIRQLDGEKLGTVGLYNREGLDAIDIGFSFLPQFEKQGYAYESSKYLLHAAFTIFNIPVIAAITTKENLSSQRLIEKLGLTFKDVINLPNDSEDLWLYQLDKDGYGAAQ